MLLIHIYSQVGILQKKFTSLHEWHGIFDQNVIIMSYLLSDLYFCFFDHAWNIYLRTNNNETCYSFETEYALFFFLNFNSNLPGHRNVGLNLNILDNKHSQLSAPTPPIVLLLLLLLLPKYLFYCFYFCSTSLLFICCCCFYDTI